MRAGKLRNPVTIEKPVDARDAIGDTDRTWIRFADAWASIEPLTAREQIVAMQTEASVTHLVTIRFLSGMLPTMRIRWGTRLFNILPPLNTDERRKEVTLTCHEVL